MPFMYSFAHMGVMLLKFAQSIYIAICSRNHSSQLMIWNMPDTEYDLFQEC